jgi:DNA-binding CsgD family transcriptional regulator/MFS family permease
MMNLFTPGQIDVYMSVLGYLLQALGMAAVAAALFFFPDKFKLNTIFISVALIEALIITAILLGQKPSVIISLSFIMNILHGMVASCYLTILAKSVPQQYRGRTFGFGYALGSLGSWLLSLPLGGSFLASKGIKFIYLFLIAATILLLKKIKNIEAPEIEPGAIIDFKPYLPILAFVVVLLLSLVKNLGFYFPVADFAGVIDLEFSRIFYALGLIVAGYLNDKSRRYGAICCLAALVFPFISVVLPGDGSYAAFMWIAGYFFFSFFSVYRIVLFSDISASKISLLPLAAMGLCAGRIGDGLGTFIGIRLSGNVLVILTATSLLFVLLVFLFFSLYQKLYIPQFTAEGNNEIVIKSFEKKYGLTKREGEVLRLVLGGSSNMEICSLLFVSESTVKFHIGNILKKTKTSNRSELTIMVQSK